MLTTTCIDDLVPWLEEQGLPRQLYRRIYFRAEQTKHERQLPLKQLCAEITDDRLRIEMQFAGNIHVPMEILL